MLFYTTITLEPTITNLKSIRICFKTSSNNIYPFPTVYTRLWKRNNDCFQFSWLHLPMIMTGAWWYMIVFSFSNLTHDSVIVSSSVNVVLMFLDRGGRLTWIKQFWESGCVVETKKHNKIGTMYSKLILQVICLKGET